MAGRPYTVPIQILLFMTGLVFLPAVLLTMTSFTRIIIVLSLLRQALGLTQTPPNQVLIGLALLLTMFVMGPVFTRVGDDALQPLARQQDLGDRCGREGAGAAQGVHAEADARATIWACS